MLDLRDKRVCVTGGFGFLGRVVCRVLHERGAQVIRESSTAYDLTQSASWLLFSRPDVVIHLAADCGGIGLNQAEPGRLFYRNLMMGLNVVEAARHAHAKVVLVGTTCSYPHDAPTPISERSLWSGYPEPTNAPYGVAKRALGTMLDAYHRQYGMPCAYLLPANLYGPGDNFDLDTSHVIPAMIRRFCEGGAVTLWGSGEVSREFLYVDDAAEAIVRAAERVETPEPLNVGTGQEVTIRDLAVKVADVCGWTGTVEWDTSKPNGQRRRRLDVSRAAELLDWRAGVVLDGGLRQTVEWWQQRKGEPCNHTARYSGQVQSDGTTLTRR